MKTYLSRFVCPNRECQSERLVEERRRVRKSIAAIRDDLLEIVYDKRYVHGVEDEDISYHCGECGYTLQDASGNTLHGEDNMAEWLLEQAAARRENLKFTCPHCGGGQLVDKVEIDPEGFCNRSFHCGDCGELICDEEERILRKMLEWEQKCAEKRKDRASESDSPSTDSGQ